MCVSSDWLIAKFGVSREDQDLSTVKSHTSVTKTNDDGKALCFLFNVCTMCLFLSPPKLSSVFLLFD